MKKLPRRNKIIFVGLAVIVVIITVAGFVLLKKSRQNSNKSNTLEAIIPPSEKNDKQLSDGSVASPPQPAKSGGSIDILGFTKDSTNYYFNINVSGITKGDCSLTVTQANKSVSSKGKVELVTSYYSCSNMKIPITSLSQGKSEITVIISSDGKTIQNTSKELTLD